MGFLSITISEVAILIVKFVISIVCICLYSPPHALSLSLSLTHTHTDTHTHSLMHTHTLTHTHTHTHTWQFDFTHCPPFLIYIYTCPLCCFEQILEVTAAVRPLNSHLMHYRNKKNKTCGALLDELICSYTWKRQCWPTNKNLHTSAPGDTGCRLDDLPVTTDDRGGWRERERVREICAVIYIYDTISLFIQ